MVDDAGDDRPGPVERFGRRDGRELRAEVLEAGPQQRDEDVLLRADEVVDGRVAHARGLGQAPHREPVEPVGFDEPGGGVEDAPPTPRLALLPAPLLLLAPMRRSHIRV